MKAEGVVGEETTRTDEKDGASEPRSTSHDKNDSGDGQTETTLTYTKEQVEIVQRSDNPSACPILSPHP